MSILIAGIIFGVLFLYLSHKLLNKLVSKGIQKEATKLQESKSLFDKEMRSFRKSGKPI